jgi:predicted NBD/HSP70 family sugar kinase
MSRAEVARLSGISAPTASKAIEALLRAGLLQEGSAISPARGRPARKLKLATEAVQILGVTMAPDKCEVVAASLDGRIEDGKLVEIDTPDTYEELLNRIEEAALLLISKSGARTIGIGITLPGLMDRQEERGLLSINLPQTNGRSPSRDLAQRLGIECVVVQDSHALCLAEWHFGYARGLHDFAILDICAGVGMGVFAGGRLLMGHNGFAGEIGHITVDPGGKPCACGSRGCLETVASEPAFIRALSLRIGRAVAWDEALAMVGRAEPAAVEEMCRLCRFLAVGLGTAVTMLNPSTVFVHSRLFAAHPHLIAGVLSEAEQFALKPSLNACDVRTAAGSKRQGAIAAVIEHVTEKLAPSILSRSLQTSHRARRAESG